MNMNDIPVINNSYVTAILGAIIFYLITFWAVDYVIDFIKWAEDSLIKVPVTDVLFGSVGLIFGLLVAFLIGFALNAVQVPILNAVAPILLTILFGYLGFQVGFKKRDELLGLFGNRSNKKKTSDEENDKEESSFENIRYKRHH